MHPPLPRPAPQAWPARGRRALLGADPVHAQARARLDRHSGAARRALHRWGVHGVDARARQASIAKGLTWTIVIEVSRSSSHACSRSGAWAGPQRTVKVGLTGSHLVLPRDTADREQCSSFTWLCRRSDSPSAGLVDLLDAGRPHRRRDRARPNYGAYISEIFRAGIQAVGHGQIEAAYALGMTPWRTMRRSCCRRRIRIIIAGYRQPVHRYEKGHLAGQLPRRC